MKLTQQRKAIIDYLQSARNHPTAEEVFTAVNRRLPTTSRATVYNTINLLKEADLIHEVFEEGAVRFDPNLSPHHHFVCRRCQRVEDVEWGLIGEIAPDALPGHRTIESYEVTLRGLCAACAKSELRTKSTPKGESWKTRKH